MTAAAPVSLRAITKRYGSTIALDGLDLDLQPGEVIGIAGPNGAGKSTLMRILAGEEHPDSGEILLGGAPWVPTSDWSRVAVVHQEPQLFLNLTVAENLMVGREGTSVARPRLDAANLGLMRTMGIADMAHMSLGDCTLATQQRTEIARAVARNASIFLFDEPNSALTSDESDELFREMHKLARSGRIVALVTHRLGDLVAHCRRVAVVRDGRVRRILEGADLTGDGIARQLVTEQKASASGDRAPRQRASEGEIAFQVRDWTHRNGAFAQVSLAARPGEILALMGVEGSGARELLRSFAGLERCTGQIEIGALRGDVALTGAAAFVPAARQYSLYTNLSVGENLLVRLGVPQIAGSALWLKRRQMQVLIADAIRRFLVKVRSPGQPVRSLSGGNQQKVAIAQALLCAPGLLLLEEPTRGVDIHSKAEIYGLLRDYAAKGHAAVIFCTELLEVYEAADTVRVAAKGRLSPPLAVAGYDHVEHLAGDVIRLEDERHAGAADQIPTRHPAPAPDATHPS